jgi:glutamate/tyrosine decarboxylase-like PLP-dependent enzyme
MLSSILAKYSKHRKGNTYLTLPEDGKAESELITRVVEFNKGCRKHWTDGNYSSGTVYTADDGHWDFIAEVMKHSIVTNPLHIDEFVYVTQCEAEIIRWTLDLYNGDKNTCGVVT